MSKEETITALMKYFNLTESEAIEAYKNPDKIRGQKCNWDTSFFMRLEDDWLTEGVKQIEELFKDREHIHTSTDRNDLGENPFYTQTRHVERDAETSQKVTEKTSDERRDIEENEAK